MKRRSNTATDRAVIGSEIVVKLGHGAHSFQALMQIIRGASEAVVVAALSELFAQGFVKRFGAKFQLTHTGYDLVAACRGRRRH